MTDATLPRAGNPARRTILAGAALAGFAADARRPGDPPFAARQGQFRVRVDDCDLFCEVKGSGPLIVLLNGMWLDSFTDHFGHSYRDALAEHYRVLTFDQRGQGRSSLGKGAISYGRFAHDTVRLLDVLGIEQAHFIGHSDGGVIQLYLLINHPERVRSAFLSGTSYDQASYRPDEQAAFARWYADLIGGRPVAGFAEQRDRYRRVAPDPSLYEAMVRAQHICWSTEPNINLRQLAFVTRPALVIDAGKDPYMPSETFQAIARAIPGARLVRLPDMTHDIVPHAAELARISADFTRALV